jgi:CubicO group peptidase (beta-lactamase class C family)
MTRRELLFGGVALALRQGKLDEAAQLIETQTKPGAVRAAVLRVQNGDQVFERASGLAQTPQAVFLLASITKPMTAAAVMTLVDRGALSLSDPVQKFIPEFRGDGRERITVRHILTHTSGLPDMLPENVELRKRHAPLKDFVSGTCRTPLLFEPGTQVRYQSMGILLASEIASRIAKKPFSAFLEEQVFRPLGMDRTSLGLGKRTISETMKSQVDEVSDWDWNSPYWRNLGAPWGGAHSTAADVQRFLQCFVENGAGVLKPATAQAMITNQNTRLPQPWGIGWLVGAGKFGKGCSAATFGHSGSTGTLCWLDPERKLSFVLLTTKPAAQSGKTLIQPVSNLASEAV